MSSPVYWGKKVRKPFSIGRLLNMLPKVLCVKRLSGALGELLFEIVAFLISILCRLASCHDVLVIVLSTCNSLMHHKNISI